jgi:transposase
MSHETRMTARLSGRRRTAACPVCGRRSRRVHSAYERILRDLPCCGARLTLCIHVRRFVCAAARCPRHIFAEQFPALASPRARLTKRLRAALQHLGLALGGQTGARLGERLGMGASGKTVLELVHTSPLPCADPTPTVLGIDDWSWRRGHRYGTLLCDLERHRLVDLLPDRSAETVAAWLQAHPGVVVVSRDRAGLYADGASRGAPQAIQVADRWHLVDNLVAALERFFLHKKVILKETARAVRDELASAAAGAQEPRPSVAGTGPTTEMYPGRRKRPPRRAWLERAEAESQQRHAARVACYERIQALAVVGADKADIARMVGVSRQTVHRYLARGSPPERRQPKRHGEVLDPWKPYLLRRWAEGCHTALRLWREIRGQGFASSSTNVARFAAGIRRGEIVCPAPGSATDGQAPDSSAAGAALVRPLATDWSARRVASLLVYRPEELSELQQTYVGRLCHADGAIAEAYRLTKGFLRLVREHAGEELDSWIASAMASGVPDVRRYACGLLKDKAAVQAGLTLCWSNGQVEGQIHRLKLLKRQMYGRAGFELLRRRVLQTA